MTKDDFTIALTLFLGAALLFYALFGGADYGAGILELFKGSHLKKEQEKLIARVMGPVWEANHIWLIIVIVIMFMGFPEAFALVSTYLHLPLTAVLFGIVARGCAFTFRHYDAYHEERSQRVYTRFFEYASLWTPFWLGVTAGALSLGRINPRATTNWELFVAPWCNLFSFATGLFAVCLFAFLAAIYLIAESETEEMRVLFRRRALAANGAAVLAGGLVFVGAILSGVNLWKDFGNVPFSVGTRSV